MAPVRFAAANEVEHADADVLPGSPLLPALDIDVQPDVWVTGSAVQLLVEAKGFKKGAAINVEQLPRELLCLHAHSGDRTPLLLLILTAPPPIRLAGVAVTKWKPSEPRMTPASLDFWRAKLKRGPDSSGISMPSASSNPTALFLPPMLYIDSPGA